MAAALVLISLAASASHAGLKPVSSSGTGAVLALAAQLRAARLQAASGAGSADAPRRTAGGRALQPRQMMHAGAILKSRAASAGVVPISGGVQTYDVNNPPAAFRPLIGYGSVTSLGNSSTNPPVYISTLTPTNSTPVWSADETFIVFSSNRTLLGGVNTDATDGSGGSRFHLWAISVNGGEAFQITTSTGPANGGEFFPTLSQNNLTVAFTSDASTPGTLNLYTLPFSYSVLSAGASAPTNLTASTANPNPPASLTLRASTEAASSALTGFDQVLRPTFSPNDNQLLVFSAHSTTAPDANGGAGFDHLYFLYTSSGGFSQGNNVSYPGKLTDGPADDTDPTYAPDGSYIAFASTASGAGFTRNTNNAFGPTTPSSPQDPSDSQVLSSGANTTRSLFLISGGLSSTGVPFGTVPATTTANLSATGGRVSQGSAAGLDDYGPAWSSFANQNQYTNPQGNFAYLAFARSTGTAGAAHDIYFFQMATGVSQPSSETLAPETAAGGANAAIKLNTDDNANETSTAGNAYDDAYPTWSPFLSIFSIAYMSNRTVTYNNPANSTPVEIAASVPRTGTVTNSLDNTQNYSVGASYEGLLVSQVLNLDPPTLLRFSANEVVHVQAGSNADPVNGTPNKLAATGGQSVTLTVRLSDREAGIANTGGPGGGPRVYVQIKDPDGKYQDAQLAEHKVFAKDPQYNGQSNQPLSDLTSGIVNAAIGTGFTFFESLQTIENPVNKYTYPSYGTPDQASPPIANRVFPRGAHGGHYFAPDSNDPDPTYIFVGKGASGTSNSVTGQGTDPAQFIPQGPEYEAQVVNPQFSSTLGDAAAGDPTVTNAFPAGYTIINQTQSNPNGTRVSNTTGAVGDYVSPFWLAGVDDQGAFSGGVYASNTGASALPQTTYQQITPVGAGGLFAFTSTDGTTQTDRPVADYTTTGTASDGTATTTTHPAEWLQLTKVPISTNGTQDGDANGGVLYSVTWTTPSSGSDFYVDVIAYDNAVFPAFPAGTSASDGHKTNWRIYDNVGGFSTNSSIGGNDILLVSDYALGQKFAATTFGGRNTNTNLVPKIFGTESYLSDVDVNILPNSVFAGIPTTPTSYNFNPSIQPLFFNSTNNALGVGSYLDGFIDDGARTPDGNSNNQSQRYSIWRILSRGPVPASLLSSYAPTPVSQPAIVDPAGIGTVPAATILDAPRCVIWLSPYTGDVLADPGTIDDPGNIGVTGTTQPRSSTTSILTSFVKSGGRLFVTGQDVGSTLTQSGTVGNVPSTTTGSPNFLPDVLNASLVSGSGGSSVLAGTDNRITGDLFYDHFQSGNYASITGPIQGPTIPIQNFPYLDNLVLGDADYGDSGLSQVPATTLPGGASIQGQSDVIAVTSTGTQVAMTYSGGGTAMVFHNDVYSATGTGQLPNGGTGSRVVYAGFGLEGLSQDYFASASPNPSTNPAYDELIPQVIARNPRAAILHNIVSYLRTGRVSGTITQTAGTGQGGGLGIDGVTVYLRPITGTAPPTRAAFSALTANGGRFTIAGVEPGTYTLVAIKPGFQRAVSNSNVSFTVEGDTTATGATLTLTPESPGSIAGVVQDTSGTQINGATVTFTSQDNSVTETATTANGSVPGSTTENYFIQNVPVTTYTGTATSPLNPTGQAEYSSATAPDSPFAASVVVQPSTTTSPVNFTLTPVLAMISGTVTSTAAGSPVVPGATVTLEDSTGATVIAGVTPAVTDANGNYTLTGVPATQTATTYTLSVTAPGFASGSATTQPVYLGSVLTGQNVSLAPIPPGSINGTVTYTTGGPVANAIVTYTAPGGTPQTVTTAADGTYNIATVPPATYTVSAIGPNNANGKPTTTSVTQNNVVVTSNTPTTANFAVVPIPPTFTGTVTSSTGTVLANATITVTDSSGNTVTSTTTAANGTYTTAALTPGTYTVTASLAGFAASSDGPVAVQLGDSLTVENFSLMAVPPGSITGTVKDNNGTPVAGAVVTFNSNDGTVKNETATTAADGSYMIPPSTTTPNVPATTYTGNAVGPNNANGAAEYGTAPAQTVTVPPGGSPPPVNFVLPANLASVSGTITDNQTSAAVSGATVTLTQPNGTVLTTTSGTNGTYAFTGILATQTASPYTLAVTATGYTAATPVTFNLSLGDALTESVGLNEQATLIGLVTDGSADATGQALGGVTLTVTNSAGTVVATVPATVTTSATTTTGPDGQPENYQATLLPGTYTITASKGNYVSQTSAAVTLTNIAPVRVNFALISSVGTLGGLVTDQTGSGLVSGATVTATLKGATTGLTFTTSATSSTGPDSSPINYTGQLAAGIYNVVVTKGSRTSPAQTITVVGGKFNRLDFTSANGFGLPALYTFPAGIQFVSTPYDYSALGFDGLFGTLNTAAAGTQPNGNRSNVAVWNPLTGAYALDPSAPADALRLGVGYWVYLKNATPVTVQGTTPTAATVSVVLGQGWNQIGVPNPAGVPVSSLLFASGNGGTITFAQASSSAYNLVTRPLYAYSGGASYQVLSSTSTLAPWKAYWIYVNSPATLEIPTK